MPVRWHAALAQHACFPQSLREICQRRAQVGHCARLLFGELAVVTRHILCRMLMPERRGDVICGSHAGALCPMLCHPGRFRCLFCPPPRAGHGDGCRFARVRQPVGLFKQQRIQCEYRIFRPSERLVQRRLQQSAHPCKNCHFHRPAG